MTKTQLFSLVSSHEDEKKAQSLVVLRWTCTNSFGPGILESLESDADSRPGTGTSALNFFLG